MLGSPNYARIVYNGESAPTPATRNGSVTLQNMFQNYFESRDLSHVLNNFSTTGGSDYWPFIHNNVPAGSIATGAGGLKTMKERTLFGGAANAPYDSCYHS